MQNRTEDYQSRINRVMDYIENNLTRDFTLEELALTAHFSKYHFHRIFYSATGETLFQFILRLRLEKAAAKLCVEPLKSITEIAMDCGFSSSAGFARRFREHFKLSASDWRRKNSNLSQTNSNYGKDKTRTFVYNYSDETGLKQTKAQVSRFPGLTAAYIRHTGPYKGDEKLFQNLFERLYRWAAPRGLTTLPDAKALVIYHDAPEITDRQKLRISVCLCVPENTKVSGAVGKMKISEGLYASASFELDSSGYQEAWNWFYCEWLPRSGYLPDDGPSFELYPEPGKTPEGKTKVVIYIPVKPAD